MRMKLLSTLALLTVTTTLLTYGQMQRTGVIRGRVLYSSTGNPFANVTVAVYSLPDSALVSGTATDQSGEFTVGPVIEGSYYIKISFIGYRTNSFAFTIRKDVPETDLGEFSLTEESGDAGTVTVTAVRPQVIYENDKKIVRVDEFRKAGAANLTQVLENIPSVTTDPEGNVLLRGSSRYTLLIDGNPAPATGTNLLRQIPAEMVETIEVMTNPSAKYDPDGSAGIINLILKKQTQAGFNGMASVMGGLGGKYSGDIQLNYRKGKVNIFGGVTGMIYNTDVDLNISRETTLPSGDLKMDSYVFQDVNVRTLNYNIGTDITLSDRNTLTISGRFGPIRQSVGLSTRISRDFSGDPSEVYYLHKNDITLDGLFYSPIVNFSHNFKRKGEKLSFNLFAGGLNGDIIQSLDEVVTDNSWKIPSGDHDLRKSVLGLDITDMRVKSDYTRPVGDKSKLELGLQYSGLTENNSNDFTNYDNVAGVWVTDPVYSNEFTYSMDVLSGYTTWSSTAGKFNYQAGLRGEYTDRLIDQITMGEEFAYRKFSLFPSLHLTRVLTKGQQMQLSYSRRINRPGRNVLNPFPQFVDDQTIVKGNPEVSPEFTGSFELNYQKQSGVGMYSVETFYRRSRDLIASLVEVDNDGRLYLTSGNSGVSHSAGGELTANLQPVSWLRLMASGSLYYYQLVDGNMAEGADDNTVTWSTNTNAIFLLTKTTRFSLSGIYTGPSINIQGRTSGAFMLNAGLNQGLMKQKLNLSLGFRDVLASYRIKSTSAGNNFKVNTIVIPEPRVLTLTVTYNFNNYQRRSDQQESMDMNLIR